MIELTSTQRRALRASAHALHPVVIIGHNGLTPAVVREVDIALKAHGLIKIRVAIDDRQAREVTLIDIANALGAAPVAHLGKLLIVWRPQDETASTARTLKPGKQTRGTEGARRKRTATKSPARDDDAARSRRRRRSA